MRMVYNPKLDEMFDNLTREGKDTSVVDAVIQLYQSLNSGQLDEVNLGITIPAAVPAGVLSPYAGSTAPTGYLLCDGSAVSRKQYSALFVAISTTYGAGDSSTTFNLPDLRGRVPVGVDGTAGRIAANDALGNTGGHESLAGHTHTVNPPNTGTSSDGSHYHSFGYGGWGAGPTDLSRARVDANSPANAWSGLTSADGAHTHTVDIAQFDSGSTGAGNAGNLQPYLTINYIIKF